jgi:hypothetical protein
MFIRVFAKIKFVQIINVVAKNKTGFKAEQRICSMIIIKLFFTAQRKLIAHI